VDWVYNTTAREFICVFVVFNLSFSNHALTGVHRGDLKIFTACFKGKSRRSKKLYRIISLLVVANGEYKLPCFLCSFPEDYTDFG